MSDISAIYDMALQMLSSRIMVLLALAMAFGLFCYAIWNGTLLALIVAGTFAVLVFLPVLWKEIPRVPKD